jgi:hypothetical protein
MCFIEFSCIPFVSLGKTQKKKSVNCDRRHIQYLVCYCSRRQQIEVSRNSEPGHPVITGDRDPTNCSRMRI